MRCFQTCYIKPNTLGTDVTGVPVLRRSVSVVPREAFWVLLLTSAYYQWLLLGVVGRARLVSGLQHGDLTTLYSVSVAPPLPTRLRYSSVDPYSLCVPGTSLFHSQKPTSHSLSPILPLPLFPLLWKPPLCSLYLWVSCWFFVWLFLWHFFLFFF